MPLTARQRYLVHDTCLSERRQRHLVHDACRSKRRPEDLTRSSGSIRVFGTTAHWNFRPDHGSVGPMPTRSGSGALHPRSQWFSSRPTEVAAQSPATRAHADGHSRRLASRRLAARIYTGLIGVLGPRAFRHTPSATKDSHEHGGQASCAPGATCQSAFQEPEHRAPRGLKAAQRHGMKDHFLCSWRDLPVCRPGA